jgi:phosphate transport system substrate-binding protein
VRLYVDRAPDKPLDAFVREYLRMVLSKEGQAIVASQKDTAEGYVPLSPADLDAALKQLDNPAQFNARSSGGRGG